MSLRDLERGSIRAFLESNQDKFGGRVLDFGSGQQPYRDVVIKAGATTHRGTTRISPGAL
jgi:hypothetical protein